MNIFFYILMLMADNKYKANHIEYNNSKTMLPFQKTSCITHKYAVDCKLSPSGCELVVRGD